MNKANLIMTAALVTAVVFSMGIYEVNRTAAATENTPIPPSTAGGSMPMMGGQQGTMPMMGGTAGMMNPQMMQQMMAMRQAHMQTIETRLANIEALLQQLVELHKK